MHHIRFPFGVRLVLVRARGKASRRSFTTATAVVARLRLGHNPAVVRSPDLTTFKPPPQPPSSNALLFGLNTNARMVQPTYIITDGRIPGSRNFAVILNACQTELRIATLPLCSFLFSKGGIRVYVQSSARTTLGIGPLPLSPGSTSYECFS